jgi:hypothetical protein
MNHTRSTSALLIGVFLLIFIAASAQARTVRPPTVLPPPIENPTASKL